MLVQNLQFLQRKRNFFVVSVCLCKGGFVPLLLLIVVAVVVVAFFCLCL